MGIEQAYIERLKAARARMGMAPKAPAVHIPFNPADDKPKKPTVGVRKFANEADRRYARIKTAMHELDRIKRQHVAAFQLNEIERAIIATAAHFSMSKADILGDSRYAHIAYPRHVSMYIAWKFMKISQSRIGKYFKRDHSTVRTAVLNIDDLMSDRAALVERDVSAVLAILSEFDLNVINYWGSDSVSDTIPISEQLQAIEPQAIGLHDLISRVESGKIKRPPEWLEVKRRRIEELRAAFATLKSVARRDAA
ncbi:helix-turn-helix domain-containing protein [Methylocystis sp. S23]